MVRINLRTIKDDAWVVYNVVGNREDNKLKDILQLTQVIIETEIDTVTEKETETKIELEIESSGLV